MQSDLLTREIIRKLLANIGVAPPPNLGKVGLSLQEYKINRSISGKYDDGQPYQYPIFGGSVKITEVSTLRCIFANLTDRLGPEEYAAVFQLDQGQIYGIRLLYDDQDCGIFVGSEKGVFKPLSTYWKAKILAGIELITSYGYMWDTCNQVEDLVSLLITLASFE